MPGFSEPCSKCSKCHGPLLLASKRDPPLKIVSSLLQANPIASCETDCRKKLPLHLACEYGASPEVIRKLIQVNKESVRKRDGNGMLPIHHVCRFYYNTLKKRIPKNLAIRSTMEVIRMILIVDLDNVLEDCEGMDLVEIALDSGMDMTAIQTLQMARSLASEKSERLRKRCR